MTAAADAPEILLRHHLKRLKLPTVLREYEKLARQFAAENVDHVRYLMRLIELELLDREARTVERRIRDARFPAVKSLESFDFDAIPAHSTASDRLFQQHPTICSTGIRPVGGGGLKQGFYC